MEKLILKAVKALQDNMGFNEITLSDGVNTVHLVRYTPIPTYWAQTPISYGSPVQYQYLGLRKRGLNMTAEEKLKEWPMPQRHLNVMMWVEAFASCAIEGNAEGKRMLALWNTDKPEFFKELTKWEEKT